jgi:hypothetical protein
MTRAEAGTKAAGVLAALAAVLVLGAAATPEPVRAAEATRDGVVVWEGKKDQWVRLEPQDDPRAPPNAHPATLDDATIAAALASVWIGEGESAEPVFTPDEAQIFATQISRALARATPTQDVTFRTTGSRKTAAGRLLKGVRVNTARAFVAGDAFNLILGEVHGQYRKKNVYGQWDEDFSEVRPASRTESAPHEWAVAPSPHVRFAQGPDGRERDDWLMFDRERLAALVRPPDAPAAAATPPPASAGGAAPAPAGAAPQAPAPVPAPSPEADMERRLRTLKDLHEKGLITEEAYRAKIEEILSVL